MAGLFDGVSQENPKFVDNSEKYAKRAELARDEAIKASDKAGEYTNVAKNAADVTISNAKKVEELHKDVVDMEQSVKGVADKAEETSKVAKEVYDGAVTLGLRFIADREYVDQARKDVTALKGETVALKDEAAGFVKDAAAEVTKAKAEVVNASKEVDKAKLEVVNAAKEVEKAKAEVANAAGEVTKAKAEVTKASEFADVSKGFSVEAGRHKDDAQVYSLQSKDHADRAKNYYREISANISTSQGLIDQGNVLLGEVKATQEKVEGFQGEVIAAKDAAAISAKEAETQKHRASVYAGQAEESKNQAGVHEENAEEYYNKTKDIYQEVVSGYAYRGLWNPNTGAYPDPWDTNSTWDLVIQPEQLETGFEFGGHTWFFGDRLVWVKSTNSYHRLPSGSTVISVNGKKGSVILTSKDIPVEPVVDSSSSDTKYLTFTGNGELNIADHNYLTYQASSGNLRNNKGYIYATGGFYDAGQKVYSPNNKPSPAEIGATTQADLNAKDYLNCADMRANNSSPVEYKGMAMTPFFTDKNNPAVGWHSGITVKGWADGYAVWQMLSSANPSEHNNKYYLRSGVNDKWGEYAEVYTSLNKPTAADVGAFKEGDYLTKPLCWRDDNQYMYGNPNGHFYLRAAKGTVVFDVNEAPQIKVGSDYHYFYHTGHKPTAKDVGAMPLDGSDIGQPLIVNNKGSKLTLSATGTSAFIGHENSGWYLYFGGNGDLKWDSNKVYHQGFKPTADEVGAIKKEYGVAEGSFTVNGTLNTNGVVYNHTLTTPNKQLFNASGEQLYIGNPTLSHIYIESANGNVSLAGGGRVDRIYHQGFKPTWDDVGGNNVIDTTGPYPSIKGTWFRASSASGGFIPDMANTTGRSLIGNASWWFKSSHVVETNTKTLNVGGFTIKELGNTVQFMV